MKMFILLIAIVGIVAAYPADLLLQRQETRDDVGQYALSFLTASGIAQTAQGALKANSARTGNVLVQRGAYAFRSPEGKEFKVTYVADENGFQATGDHLPK